MRPYRAGECPPKTPWRWTHDLVGDALRSLLGYAAARAYVELAGLLENLPTAHLDRPKTPAWLACLCGVVGLVYCVGGARTSKLKAEYVDPQARNTT